MANIKMYYLYRDAANYKNHGEVVFTNPRSLSIEEIEAKLRENLIDGEWFYANKCGLKDLHFDKWDPEIDHEWHEFASIEYTNEVSENDRSIDYFLKAIL